MWCRPLAKAYQEVLRTVFMSSSSCPSGANKKKSMKDLQEEITNLYNNIRLFEKGTKFFSGKSWLHTVWIWKLETNVLWHNSPSCRLKCSLCSVNVCQLCGFINFINWWKFSQLNHILFITINTFDYSFCLLFLFASSVFFVQKKHFFFQKKSLL